LTIHRHWLLVDGARSQQRTPSESVRVFPFRAQVLLFNAAGFDVLAPGSDFGMRIAILQMACPSPQIIIPNRCCGGRWLAWT
jgi:hypothetical protein